MENPTVNIWLGEITAAETEYPLQWSFLDESERQQARKFKNELQCRNYVAIHAKLREMLGETVDTPPEKLRILKSQYGKPYLADFPHVVFNLSHTANMAAIAITYRSDIGIDIEWCKPRSNISGLVQKCFGDAEKRYWEQLPDNLKTLEFYRFWTRKEAFVKATGRGISLGLNQCVINPDHPSEFLALPKEFGKVSSWRIQDLDTKNAGSIAGAWVMKCNEGFSM